MSKKSDLLASLRGLSIFAHCTDDELARLAASGSSIAHCPTSQQFLGSGTMPWRRTVGRGVTPATAAACSVPPAWAP